MKRRDETDEPDGDEEESLDDAPGARIQMLHVLQIKSEPEDRDARKEDQREDPAAAVRDCPSFGHEHLQ